MKQNTCITLFFFSHLINISFALGGFVVLNSASATPLMGEKAEKTWLIAQNKKSTELNAYDPFADYSEFENTAEEQENINFFQTGRFLSLGALGGVKLFTANMSFLYQLGPYYGGYLTYFFDLKFAVQFGLTGSSHSIAIKDPSSGANFVGSADFVTMQLNFKYFLDKSLFNKNFHWLAPYFFLGVLHSSVTLAATYSEQPGFYKDSGFGVDMGLGLEFHISRKVHLGLQYAFQFVTLEQEAIPLYLTTGNNRQNTNFRPHGDWMNISMLLGVNF